MFNQGIWDEAKAVLREKRYAIQAYLRIQEKSQINILTLQPNQIDKEEQTKPKSRRRKEIMMIKTEINGIERKKTI